MVAHRTRPKPGSSRTWPKSKRPPFADFVGSNWQVFVPVFLTLLTAIVIPLVVFWWKRRNRPAGPGSTSDRSPPDDGWL